MSEPPSKHAQLARVLHTPGALLLGMGAIIGTGVYVSIGIAAGVAGAMVLPALVLAAAIAFCNGLSSAQLAAAHPVSGGTYEYGYRYLGSTPGFLAGWLFLLAKSASAAAAALGFGAYLGALAGTGTGWQVPLALALIAVLTVVVLAGLRNTIRINAVLVFASVGALLAFVAVSAPVAWTGSGATLLERAWPRDGGELAALLQAAALMFVAFTGYGRVATLGEEVVAPRHTIPRAIGWTIAVTFGLYFIVAACAIGSTDPVKLGAAAAKGLPLAWVAGQLGRPVVADIVAIGALFALAGVLLNLVLGLSRVVLAMARRGDMPSRFARLNAGRTSPSAAIVAVAIVIAIIAAPGSIKAAWSFSAFTVLLYYGVTNLAALRVADAERFIPRAVSVAGLIGCAALAWFVETRIWLAGLAVIAAGLAWHAIARYFVNRRGSNA